MNEKLVSELLKLALGQDNKEKSIEDNSIYKDFLINKQVIVRTYSAGVYYGTLTVIQSTEGHNAEGILENARLIHSWTGAKTILDIANKGIASGNLSGEVSKIYLSNIIAVNPASESCIKQFNSFQKSEYKF